MIRNERKKRKISQKALAEAIGVERSTIAKWETGKTLPRGENLIKLSSFFQCPLENLLNNAERSTYETNETGE